MQAGVRERGAGPPRGERLGRASAAVAVRARRRVSARRLAAREPLRVLECRADAHRERATRGRLDAGGAPVGANRLVGVLVVRAEAVFDVEDAPRAPLPAHELALDGPERVGGEAHAVVLVRLRDDAGLAHLEEVDRDAEVVGCEVREPVGGRLVAHAVGVAQILDGEGAALLGPG